MVKLNKLIMLSKTISKNLTYLLLFLNICAVFSYPSTPLNERQEEISWQAWLLVDDQNQNYQRHGDGSLPRRRITPKSVFVAPSFSPDNLPPCAEGYSSDSMGRCIKIIKLDEDKHLEFLVSKLQDKFGSIDYEEELEIEEIETPKVKQPFQLNIPLNLDGNDYSNDTPDEGGDIAIIVTPMAKESGSDKSKDIDKRNDKDYEKKYEEELKKLLRSSTTKKYETTTIQDVESVTVTDKTIDITTKDSETTTLVTDITINTTEFSEKVEENENYESTTDSPQTTTQISDSSTTEEEQTTTQLPVSLIPTKPSTTTPKITTYHPVATTYHPYFDMSSRFGGSKIKNLIRFPQEDEPSPRIVNYVRFPDMDSKVQEESEIHHTRNVDDQYGNFYNEIVTQEPSLIHHQIVLPDQDLANHKRVEYHHVGTTTEKTSVRKHRENHNGLFLLPPHWGDNRLPRPLVLRFSKKHVHFDTNSLKTNEFYRSMPMEDFSYLFGYKQRKKSHR